MNLLSIELYINNILKIFKKGLTSKFNYDIISGSQGQWPIGQAVKTLASHAGNSGSIPGWVTKNKKEQQSCSFLFLPILHESEPVPTACGGIRRALKEHQ